VEAKAFIELTDTVDEYSTNLIESILTNWPAVQAAKKAGVLSINVSDNAKPDAENRAATKQLAALVPRPNRKRNIVYSIDSLACLVMDVELAMEVALSKKARVRLLAYYEFGYSLGEVALMEGVSDEAVRQMNRSSMEKMAAWLESPKSAKADCNYRGETAVHSRSYSFPESYFPPQR